MKKSITPNQIKENNRSLIYQYIYKNRKVSQQDISYALRLSRPTVTANLNELETCGLIRKNGQIDSEYVGRKAAAYSIIADFRISIGVEILKNEIKMIAINLYGEKIDRKVCEISYENKDAYYKNVVDQILDFLEMTGAEKAQVLGIGFAMQALISTDEKTVIYGKILSCTGLSIDVFSRYLPYPCYFIHDANGAALSELWLSPHLENAFYLSLGVHLGAATIVNGTISIGKHGHNSTIEHIQMEAHGKLCYCGKYGCMETLCSLSALLSQGEEIDNFFRQLRDGNPVYQQRWDKYLTDLATAINLLHLVHDTDFILGGYLAPYICQEDIQTLHQLIHEMTPFEEAQDFIYLSKMPKHNIAIGAALPYVQRFLAEL
ncbi:MAG: ROK family transcriptional regulator [Lachnospiraceae bacterium]|nr:ROK family transcriptional regulator [Lachnospiraceae bacterium]